MKNRVVCKINFISQYFVVFINFSGYNWLTEWRGYSILLVEVHDYNLALRSWGKNFVALSVIKVAHPWSTATALTVPGTYYVIFANNGSSRFLSVV